MSVADKLTKLNTDLTASYNAIEEQGGTVPANKNTENLASAILSIPKGEVATYTELEYIESTGTQYIDTGITSNQYRKCEIEFITTSLGATQVIEGCYRDISNVAGDIRNFLRVETDGTLNLQIGNYEQSWYKISSSKLTVGNKYNVKYEMLSNSCSLDVNNTKYTSNYGAYLIPDNYNIFVFACNNMNTNAKDFSCIKLSKLKYYDINDRLMRDFIPVLDESGVACLYDKVTKTYFYNKGTGSFIAGDGQLVNYTMLYDGSLGEAGENGANVCFENTGGYYTNFNIDTSFYKVAPINFLNNEMNINQTATGTTSNSRQFSSFATKNPINLSEYNKGILQAKVTLGGSNPAMHTYGYINLNSQPQSGVANTAVSILLKKPSGTDVPDTNIKNNQKAFYVSDVSGFFNDVYFSSIFGREEQGTVNIHIYEMFLTKADDWQTLANLAGITANSIDDILTNSTTLLSNEEAIKFMIKQCTGDFMASAIQSETFLTALNNSSYKTKIYANKHWSKFLTMVA